MLTNYNEQRGPLSQAAHIFLGGVVGVKEIQMRA